MHTIDAEYPLSPMQQGLLFHTLAAPASGVYVAQVLCRLDAEVDPAALESAWRAAVARHAILRTSFAWDGVEPLQRVHRTAGCAFERLDWRALDAGGRQAHLDADRQRGFDLQRPPLMRLALCDLPDGDRLLVWTHHQILLDGRARVAVLKDVARLYDAAREGRDADLPAPPSYAAYIDWQRAQAPDGAEAFWRGLVGDLDAVATMAPDGPAAEDDGEAGNGVCRLDLPDGVATALHRTAHRCAATVNILVQAAWSILSSRYGGATSVVFGATRSCRRAGFDGVASVVGVVMNTLPHRLDVEAHEPFTALVDRLRAQHVAVRKYQDTPLAKIREWNGVHGRAALFDSVVVFEERDLEHALRAEGLALWRRGVHRAVHTHYGLTVTGYTKPSLRLEIAYRRDRFADAAAARLGGHLVTLLTAIVADPQACCGDLPMLTPAERQQILTGWNATAAAVEDAGSVSGRFLAQAAQTPDAVALVGETGVLSYGALAERSAALAQALRARGVGAETRVGICAERSPAMVVGVLGVLRAGGAYVPIHPTLPRARQAAQLAAAGATLLLTDGCEAERPNTIPVVDIDCAVAAGRAQPRAPRLDDPRATQAAYILYTSGSTGQPKGVVVEHRQLLNYLSALQQQVAWTPGLRCALVQPLAVDASVTVLYGTLLTGGALHLVDETTAVDADAYAAYAHRHGIDVLKLAPSHLAALRVNDAAVLPPRMLLLGGEALPPAWAARLVVDTPATIVNQYGPTETTVGATLHTVTAASCAGLTVPMGRPLAHVRVYIVDALGQPVPVGVGGELWIGGAGVARGYVGQPALTATRFVADPWGPPGARVYRTGDRVRWRPDGSLEFLGRTDDQVKVRGFRVELGEIAAMLRRETGVQDAIALAHGEGPAARVIAYVVRQASAVGDAALAQALTDAARRTLPPYMVPAPIVVLTAWPRTPHGKLDRRALPAPEPAAAAVTRAPRTPDEEMLCELFADVLGVPAVGVDDDFFLHGGHSLLATRLVSRIRATLGVELAIRTLFEAPTVGTLAARLRRAVAKGRPPVVAVDRSTPVPASYAQQRLWFLDQLGGTSAYTLVRALRLRGSLDRLALARALTTISARHETLRTCFADGADGPVQIVLPPADVPIAFADLRELPARERAAAVAAVLREERTRPFALRTGPIVRARLLRLAADDHVLAWTCHHIAADGWSLSVFNRELTELYAAYRAGGDDPLPPLPVQYGDFTLWQRAWLEGGALEPGLAYWQAQLADAPERLDLPTDRPRRALASSPAAVHRLMLDAPAVAALKQVGKAQGATLFMTLLTAAAALLTRYSGQDEIVVGAPIANRRDTQLEGLIGFFVNSLPLRVRMPRDITWAELVAQVRQTTLGGYQHQDVPFERIVDAVAPSRDLDSTPLFQVVLALQNTPQVAPALADLTVTTIDEDTRQARYDLEIHATEVGGQLRMGWLYNSELFDRWRIAQLARHFVRLLDTLAADPRQRVADAALLDAEERRRVLTAWNDTAHPVPATTMAALVEAQAARTPHAVAVVAGTDAISYAALEARANQIACRLRREGAGPEGVVGLALPRGIDLVVAMVGALKSGAAYLPLDLTYPVERLAFMLADTAPVCVMTTEASRPRLPEGGRYLSIDAPDVRAALDALPADRLPSDAPHATPDNAAYIIYTSGSTGVPKGVVIAHRSAVTFLHWARDTFDAGELSCVLASTSVCFDLSIFEIFAPLSCGGTVLVAPTVLDLPALPAADRVRTINTVPSAMAALVDAGLPAGLRTVNLAGEPLSVQLVDDIYASSRVRRVLNLYGPTEDTTYSTWTAIERGADAVTIGRPLWNTSAYVLDDALQPVPAGVAGDLYLAGDGLARGYHKRPALTAGRFVAGLFGAPGSRMYRTGDRVRWRADGQLDFLGRVDDQIKIRGYRVELGEIESGLRALAGVQDAIVAARGDGDRRHLVAYAIGDPARLDPEALLDQVRETLPAFMVPANLVVLTTWPRTPTGKIDRRALPAPELPSAVEIRAPRTPDEEMLCELFAEVLGAAAVGVDDDFFARGGHSLLATRLVSRIRATLGVDLAIRTLFEAPTAGALAARLRRDAADGRPPIVAGRRPAVVPASYAQQRLWFLDRLQERSTEYHMRSAWRLRGPLDRAALTAAIATIVERHESLRTGFAEGDDGPVQIVMPAAGAPIEYEDLQALDPREQGAAVGAALKQERTRPFSLATGPFVRMQLLRLAAEDHVLVRTCHHIAADGWSLGVFNRELTELYAAYREGGKNPLAPLPVQYADFSLWQRAWLEHHALAPGLAYWRAQLADVPERLDLPTDRPRQALIAGPAAAHRMTLDATVAVALKRAGESHGATLFMTLLAGLAALLARHSGQDDLIVGAPIANRQDTQLEGLIGFFVNSLPLRVRVPHGSSFASLIADVKQTTLDGYQHQDVPFERIVDAVAPARRLDTTPLFQCVLALQNWPQVAPALTGVAVSAIDDDTRQARYDLEIFATEAGGALHLAWVYKADLFDAWRVEQWARHYARMLEALAADPKQRAVDVPLIDEAERRQILTAWNATAPAIEDAGSLGGRFLAQAAQTPDAVALVGETGVLSYGGLAERSAALAQALRARGVGAETRVGICAERSPAMVVGVLGVLRAGGAYVPIHPALPRARQAAQLFAAGATLLLTDGCEAERPDMLPVIDIDSAVDEGRTPSHAIVLAPPRAAQAAYVLYTSGSTGQPKGVVVEHRQVLNYLAGLQACVSWAPGVRCALVQPLAVDASVTVLYGTLLTGGALHLVDETTAVDADAYAAYARRHGIDVLKLAPSHLAALQASADRGLLPPRTLLLGGEALRPAWAARLVVDTPATIVNQYGPTETTVGATLHTVTAASCTGLTVPMGRPLANVRVYVVDVMGQPVPVGVGGELWIGGAGVARGYVGQPALTATRFVADPWGPPGARVYRTGDRVRWRPDGALEFLGRTDDQVKVRGFRVELAEIAAVLRREAGVQDAIALAHGEGAAARVIAYVVRQASAVSDTALAQALTDAARRTLPPYMVPAPIVVLTAWPRTPHGKLDRRALPAPEPAAAAVTRAPRTPDEEMLCELFADVLGVPAVGVDDDFFLHGGHSLLATRLVSRIRATLGVELAIRTLFEAPTVSMLAARLRGVQLDARPAVVANPRPAVLPTSYAQQRLWFLDRLQQQSTEYHIRTAWRLRGPLDVGALARAVQAIVDRHESLRTCFVETDGEISQAIAPVMPIAIPVDDVSALGPDAQHQATMDAMARARDERFDLSRGPLLRLRLLRLGPEDHVLVHVVHHVVSDGWSRTVFNRELLALYTAFRDGRPDPLPPLAVQYADYALWQRRWLDDDGLAEERTYWRHQLAGIPDRLDLPTDRPRPPQQTFDAGVCVATVPAEQCAALKRLGQSEHATLYMVLLSAFAVLLARYADQDDILVGSPIANRRDASLEELIGIFINSLVLRVRVDGGLRFRDLVAQVRNTALDAYKHQDMPFERLVEDLAPQRSMSTSPIVQVLLAVQNVPDHPFALPDLSVEPVRDEARRVRYDLELHVREAAGRLTATWVYNRVLFDHWRIDQMSRHLARVLETMTDQPDASLDELELLTADERQAIACAWNPTVPASTDGGAAVETGGAMRVDVAFDAWARQAPDALAVLGASDEWTYRELHERATRLARRLRTLGAGRGAVVGVAMRRTPWMLASLVGVLKSGAAYLPLDPSLPDARLRFVVGDAGAALVVTDGATRDRVEGCGARLVDVGDLETADASDDDVALRDTSADLDDRAYIIYTSGSTGTPKGVAIAHRSLASIMADLRGRLGVTESTRIFAVSNIAFDIAATELLLPLTSGASCWVASDTLAGGDAVIREMSSSGCTIVQATPSGWRAILDQGWRGYGEVMGLTAGEPLPWWLGQELLQTCSTLWNLYGPTETTIYSTGHRLELDDPVVPIGRPVARTQVYVLDARLRPVPPGVIGELYIGGAGVAMGYVKRPRLTAASFVADPFSDVPGRRLYRTGDLVRSRLDGVVEYVGRRDHQVKLRGFRIELGEIEAAIAAHPGFRESVVIAREDAAGDARLVAYVVPDGDLPESTRALTDELKRVVKERLPEYMMPGAVVWLPALPLTPSGKVDRKQLPAPDLQADRPAFVAPETDAEKAMVGIWREVIGCGDVGLYDNFFDLGGHSLTAIKITARVWRDFGVELPLHVVFDRPVLADMAAYVATCQPDPSQV